MMAKEDILLDELRKELQTEKLEPLGGGGGGCIGFGQGYVTDQGQVFVKQNRRPGVSMNTRLDTDSSLCLRTVWYLIKMNTSSIATA